MHEWLSRRPRLNRRRTQNSMRPSTSRRVSLSRTTRTLFAFFLVLLAAATATTDAAAARKKKAATRAAPPVLAVPVPIPRVDPQAVAADAEGVVGDANRWIDAIEGSGQVAGLAVAIVKDDAVVLERVAGYADWDTRTPVTATTVFRLASLSKGFASALAALIVGENRLRWETRITDLLPTFTLADIEGGQQLTVRDILSQRVGLPSNTYDRLLEADEPYPLLVERLRDVPLVCPVGACYGYQNISFSLIGDVTYAATGDFFYHQVEKRLFHPLGMDTATYGRDGLESSAAWARPHRRAGTGFRSFQPKETYYRIAPAAGVNASIRDMEAWLIAQMGGRPGVLPLPILDLLHTPQIATDHEQTTTPWRRGRLLAAHYGLGWRVFDYAGETMVFHAGAVQGYRGVVGFLPKYRFGIVMLWNSESPLPSGLLPMVMDRYLGLPAVDWAGIEVPPAAIAGVPARRAN